MLASTDYWTEARITPAPSVTVGSAATLEIDVLVNTWFVEPPRFENWTLEGARVTYEGSQGRNLHETRDGKPYFGLTFSYQIVPTRAGKFEIPPLTLTMTPGLSDGPVSLSTEPVRFTSALPEALASRWPILMASSVEVRQTLQPESTELIAGALVIREVSIDATGAQTIRIPSIDIPGPEGVRGERKPPTVTTLTNERGQAVGARRLDAVGYIVDTPGNLTLPAFTLTWWDTTAGRLVETTVPAIEVAVKPATVAASPFPLHSKLAALQHRRDTPFPWWAWPALALLLAWLSGLARRPAKTAFQMARVGRKRLWSTWLRSTVYLRYRARRRMNQSPPDLLGLYHLRSHCDGAHLLLPPNDDRLSPPNRSQLEQGLAECFGKTGRRATGKRTLKRMIRVFGKQMRGPRDRVRRGVLPPLNGRT
ncbi:MAG: BatD family protein [Marinobacter sp.]|uniref:BatD family protein n=1 Tax=Marinobacter sp. TaxID=50741 RepID=UPI00299D6838|nr:BatD family protein [Marinobacter sp.]MDX1755224.1 BatD family protein [Marinobacter sp.]